MITISTIADAAALQDQEIGVSEWVEITQQQIDQFAAATGDHQWIHVDPERAARELPGGKTIAHGYLTLALIPKLTSEFVRFEGLQRTINFGCNKVRFSTMISPGDRVRIRTSVVSARKRAGALYLVSQHRIEVEGQKKPACSADTIGMYFLDAED
ncbi:MAG: MaoC family dehydratase [Woeseiaceae bacterium]